MNNNPFSLDQPRYEGEEVYEGPEDCFQDITLEHAKKFVPDVSYQEFRKHCEMVGINPFLHDPYYMHYLCIKGDMIRIKNFVQDLRHRQLNIEKIITYPFLAEFDYGNCFHTAVFWGENPDIVKYFLDELMCDGEDWCNKNGVTPFEFDIDFIRYYNPFRFILGEGQKKMKDNVIYCVEEGDRDTMKNFLTEYDREQDEMVDAGNNQEEEEELEGELEEEEELEGELEEGIQRNVMNEMQRMIWKQSKGRIVQNPILQVWKNGNMQPPLKKMRT